MLRLFEGYAGAHGTYSAEDRNEAKGGKLEIKRTARTIRQPVTVQLWTSHLAGERPIGVIPIREDNLCKWGNIDIDIYDLNVAELAQRVHDLGLPLLVFKSKSGGAHLRAFLEEFSPAEDMTKALREIAAMLGYGNSEIYPKQAKIIEERGDLGSWMVMPYGGVGGRGGDESERYCVKRTGAAMTMAEFLSVAEKSLTTISALRAAGSGRRAKLSVVEGGGRKSRRTNGAHPDGDGADPLDGGPPCLQHLSGLGFPEGTRNNGLMALGVFAKKKFGSGWKEKLEEFNRDYMTPPLPHSEVGLVVRSLERKDYNYKCDDEPICSHCNSVLCRTRKYGVAWSDDYPLISGLSVLDSDPPLWFADVEGERLEMTTDDLQNYKRFHKIAMEKLRICYQMLKQDTWLRMVSLAMKDANIIEAPPEVGLSGHFSELLEDFCTNRHRGEQKEDILSGKPWEDQEHGKHYFRLRDLQTHLDRAGFKNYGRGAITSRLKTMGGDADFFNISRRGVNVWWVPVGSFQPAEPAPKRQAPEDPI